MKKTLTTAALMLCLAGSAFADTPSPGAPTLTAFPTSSGDVAPSDFSTADGSYQQLTVTVVLDWDELTSVMSTVTGDSAFLDLCTSGESNKVTFGFSNTNLTDGVKAYIKAGSHSSYSDVITSSSDYLNNGLLTFSLKMSADGASLYGLKNDDSVGEVIANNNGIRYQTASSYGVLWVCGNEQTPAYDAINSIYAYNRALTNDEILAVSTAAIPEPTTATLSLLALAGLAARRRRK